MKKILFSICTLIMMASLMGCQQTKESNETDKPLWERKSAPAVILGRYVDWKAGDNPFPPGFWGNRESLKGNGCEITKDSINGTFSITYDICYPLQHQCMNGLKIMLFPGDTVRLDYNRSAFAAYEAYNRETPRDSITTEKLQELWKKAVHMEGGYPVEQAVDDDVPDHGVIAVHGVAAAAEIDISAVWELTQSAWLQKLITWMT